MAYFFSFFKYNCFSFLNVFLNNVLLFPVYDVFFFHLLHINNFFYVRRVIFSTCITYFFFIIIYISPYAVFVHMITQQRRERVLSSTTSPGVPVNLGMRCEVSPGAPDDRKPPNSRASPFMVAGVGVRIFAAEDVTRDPFSGLALDRDWERCFLRSANVPAFNSSNSIPFSLFLSNFHLIFLFIQERNVTFLCVFKQLRAAC